MLFHERQEFEPWAKHLIVINSLLCTINSSCNFAFYCGDVVFRECLSAVSRSGFSKFNLKTQGQCCKSHNTIDGTDDNMVEMEEVTLRASNPQSDQISKSPRSSSSKKVNFCLKLCSVVGKVFLLLGNKGSYSWQNSFRIPRFRLGSSVQTSLGNKK